MRKSPMSISLDFYMFVSEVHNRFLSLTYTHRFDSANLSACFLKLYFKHADGFRFTF